mmetsp:Transcript_23521/g.70258  ORF Transcript_23521/g.70258 Transcript_23521/m.70258 type:complete len:134 (+) Transcript_23521:69-470(+)
MALVLRGEWTAETSGGCPKYATWPKNPQFALRPSTSPGAAASYTLTLKQEQQGDGSLHPIGLWVMRSDGTAQRKESMTKADMIGKTKFKACRSDSCPRHTGPSSAALAAGDRAAAALPVTRRRCFVRGMCLHI